MKFLFLLLVTLLLQAEDVCIQNFSKPLCGDFKVLNSIIIKSKLSKDGLKKYLDKKIQQIAFLGDANIYLIYSKNPIEESKQLSYSPNIIYAQANILQSKNKSFNKNQQPNKRYNLNNIWEKTKGEGVNIAIIDDGFDLTHPDLKDTELLFSYDTDNKNLNTHPKLKFDTHGTQVAGIIFAKHNTIGSKGIAPNAKLIAIRQTRNITSETIIAFTVAKKAGAHIINCSWNSPILLEPVYDIIKYLSQDTAMVFAAGNNSREIKPLSIEASIPEVITVGATQKYSNYGKMVDFVIPSNIFTTKINNNYGVFGGTSATAPVISALLALKISLYHNVHYKKLVDELKEELKR